MFPIVTIRSLEEKMSFRSKLKVGSTRRVRCALAPFVSVNSQNGAGTVPYSTSAVIFRAQNMNGFLIPERYEGEFFDNRSGNDISISPLAGGGAVIQSSGAVHAIMQRRYVLPFALPAGRIISNMRVYTPSNGTSVNFLSEVGGAVGIAGTLSVQANLGFLTTANVLSQKLTAQQAMTLNGTTQAQPLSIADAVSTGTSAADDWIYLELIADANQTARTSGSQTIQALFMGGATSYPSSPMRVLYVEFDLA